MESSLPKAVLKIAEKFQLKSVSPFAFPITNSSSLTILGAQRSLPARARPAGRRVKGNARQAAQHRGGAGGEQGRGGRQAGRSPRRGGEGQAPGGAAATAQEGSAD